MSTCEWESVVAPLTTAVDTNEFNRLNIKAVAVRLDPRSEAFGALPAVVASNFRVEIDLHDTGLSCLVGLPAIPVAHRVVLACGLARDLGL